MNIHLIQRGIHSLFGMDLSIKMNDWQSFLCCLMSFFDAISIIFTLTLVSKDAKKILKKRKKKMQNQTPTPQVFNQAK